MRKKGMPEALVKLMMNLYEERRQDSELILACQRRSMLILDAMNFRFILLLM